MEDKYIQLPPLPADLELPAFEFIWKFATLGHEEQKEALEYIRTIDTYYEEDTDLELLEERLKEYESAEVSDTFAEFIEMIKRLIGYLIRDSYGLAGMIYQKRCVENKSVEEISKECGLAVNKIQLFVDYFDVRKEMETTSGK